MRKHDMTDRQLKAAVALLHHEKDAASSKWWLMKAGLRYENARARALYELMEEAA